MEWIRDNRRPQIIETSGDWGKSKKVLVQTAYGEVVITEFNSGTTIEGEPWEQWYSPVYEDIIENVIGWCDCIPHINN